ncbi:MAG: hypothetical protein MZU97_02810 [Bacillus subtilis]|nr:hypothetical protein [Bacillus subtilis]
MLLHGNYVNAPMQGEKVAVFEDVMKDVIKDTLFDIGLERINKYMNRNNNDYSNNQNYNYDYNNSYQYDTVEVIQPNLYDDYSGDYILVRKKTARRNDTGVHAY